MKQQLARGEGTAGQRWRSSCLPARLGRRCLACLLADRTASRSQAMSGAGVAVPIPQRHHAAAFSTATAPPNSSGERYGERAPPELHRLRARHVAVLEVEARATMAAQQTAHVPSLSHAAAPA